MTDPSAPTDRSEFNESLAELLERTYEAGVDIEGAYKCMIDGNGENYWDVQITAVEYDAD